MKTFLLTELSHYSALPAKTRTLIVSFGLRSIAYPVLSIFINAFIWRSTGSLLNVALYNLGFFMALPAGFFVTGLLLKRMNIAQSYVLGLVVSMMSAFFVVIFTGAHPGIFLLYGLIYGFGSGLYWSSRNYLTLQETNNESRNYFFSISHIADAAAGITISFLAGWIIVWGEYTGHYSPLTAYWVLILFAFVFILLSGAVLSGSDYRSPSIDKLWLPRVSRIWNTVRMVSFGIGFLEGVKFFLPAILILLYIGKEGILGTVTAMVTLLTIVLIYLYGRLAKTRHRKHVFIVSILLHLLLAAYLAFGNHGFNVLVYVLLSGVPLAFHWLTLDPWLLHIMDKEMNHCGAEKKFMLVFDVELFLNVGRITSVLILFILFKLTNQAFALQTAPLVLALGQAGIMGLAWRRLKLGAPSPSMISSSHSSAK